MNTEINKAAVAREIFVMHLETGVFPKREDLIQEFVKFAQLTANGAATYLQNLRRRYKVGAYAQQ